MGPRGWAKGQPRQEWQEIVLSYWCPDCDAGPGRWCLTRNGHDKPEPHAARVEMVARCVRCHQWMTSPQEIGADLCPRCSALVR